MTEDLGIRMLIVDDEQTIRHLCMTVGESLGLSCIEAESGDAALALLEEQPVHMVLTDMVMPQMTGIEFLEQVKRLHPRVEVAVMTGHGSVKTAVQAMKFGAYDYIAKPFAPLDDCATSYAGWPTRSAWWKRISICASDPRQKHPCTELSAIPLAFRMFCG